MLLTFNLSADYLKANSNICITDDWYFAYKESASKDALYYYKSTSPTILRNTTSTRQEQYLISGYEYDSLTGICAKNEILVFLGLTKEHYSFLIGLTALLAGFTTLLMMIYIVIGVAKK